ncbi:hypothetical protein Cylst_3846 [Cylindrospermum stagnale PCC 7417]|uniref:DUF4365 domain-containing protein n=1 Tax=Cylindrospermum stagnale PCC 7417 TaxID=56107 RepID=K9X1P3_9NOST|nr:DUF4365 domain-containing protein [Cylindrospermum stagnale]AFZ25961.1 hypothetical protein Cylst_3846 [Cylindrospermum stagnale PCC 7417]
MQTEQPWYIGLRSEALTKVYLTRRDDLIISQPPQKDAGGLDFLVTITKDGNYSGRIFGVQVKATASSSELIQQHNFFKLKNIKYNIKSFKDLPFPLCLFFFTLDNDKGYYKWILEPIVKDGNNAALKFNENDELRNLNDQEIDNIIAIVNNWYDHKINFVA